MNHCLVLLVTDATGMLILLWKERPGRTPVKAALERLAAGRVRELMHLCNMLASWAGELAR